VPAQVTAVRSGLAAMELSLMAGDAAAAARLVERHVETLLGRSEGATLRRSLSALPAESVLDRPRRSSTTSRSSATSPGR
jgi:ATP/maltotriose-dependent transcriptional regulator MalT